MKTHLIQTSLILAVATTGLAAQGLPVRPAGPLVQKAASKSQPPADGSLYSQPDQTKRAEAYADFMLGHLAEQQFDTTGRSGFADQAIQLYQKALALDPDASITERLAEIYAASQQMGDAVREAQEALQQDPDNLAAHRLLARIYIRSLGNMTDMDRQKSTIRSAVEQLLAVQKLDPGDAQSALWLARMYGFENQPEQAERVLRGILAHSPDSGGALEQLSQLLLDEGRPQDAISLLDQAANGSHSAELYDLLGDAYSKTENYAKAEEAYRKATEMEPDEASHRRGLAEALLANDKYEAALEQYQRLTQMEPDAAENYLRMSQIYRHLNELDKAESSLEQAKRYAHGSLEVLYNEALLDEAQARYSDAVQVLSDAIAGLKAERQQGQPPSNALTILYEQLGMAYRDAGNYPAAERTFQDMQGLGPGVEKHAELLLIDTYRVSGDIDRAIAEAQKERNQNPDDQSLTITYAMLLGEKDQTGEAAKVLRGLLHGRQADREIYLDLAQVEERGRRYADAQKDAKTALAMSHEPSEQEAAWFLLGAVNERQKRYDAAERMFRKALAVNPHDAMVLNYYGYMLADRGQRLEEATSLIRQAVIEDPTNGAYLDSLGWVYYKQNKLAEAEQYLSRAVDHAAHDPTILGHLGDVYAKLGQPDRAAALWEKALAAWQKALPADYEADHVADLQAKLKHLKRHLAQKSASGESKPQ